MKRVFPPLLKAFRFLVRGVFWGVFLCALVVGGANLWVVMRSAPHLVADPGRLPTDPVGLVLGTSPRFGRGGGANPFFEGRMDTTAALFHAGCVSTFVLSGDNRTVAYNEPQAMKGALLQRGVPPGALVLEAAGFRTYESMRRIQETHPGRNVVIITDDFHLPRAVFLARARGVLAVGFVAKRVPWPRSYRTRVREWFSRVRACADVGFGV